MNILKKIIKAILIAVAVLAAALIFIILYAVVSDYRPKEKVTVFSGYKTEPLSDTAEITLLTWNIGYCGLDSAMDFFYDGGTKVFTPEPILRENLMEVKKFLKQNDSIDFILLQEIDTDSKRSYHINEFDTVCKVLPDHYPFFATNYKVFFVPVPPTSPMGKVYSGLATYSRYKTYSSVRYSFPGKYGFPKQLFMLDRCFLVNRYPLANGKELILINTHNEAFDPGQIRRAQMAYLKEFMIGEYQKGNYIVAGGDWNQNPPDFRPAFTANKADTAQMMIPADYLPSGWTWLYDNTTPSERNVIAAYDPSTTTTNIFDFFLISPNIKGLSVEGIRLNFRNSDHNPVRLKVRISG